MARKAPPSNGAQQQLPVGWEGWRDELAVLPIPSAGCRLTPKELSRVRRCMHEVARQYDAETLADFQTFLAEYYRTTPEAIKWWFDTHRSP